MPFCFWIRLPPPRCMAAAAHDGDTANVEMLLHQQHRGASVARRNGRREAGGACSEDDDVDFAVPANLVGLGGWRSVAPSPARVAAPPTPAIAPDLRNVLRLPLRGFPLSLLSTISILLATLAPPVLHSRTSISWVWTRVVPLKAVDAMVFPAGRFRAELEQQGHGALVPGCPRPLTDSGRHLVWRQPPAVRRVEIGPLLGQEPNDAVGVDARGVVQCRLATRTRRVDVGAQGRDQFTASSAFAASSVLCSWPAPSVIRLAPAASISAVVPSSSVRRGIGARGQHARMMRTSPAAAASTNGVPPTGLSSRNVNIARREKRLVTRAFGFAPRASSASTSCGMLGRRTGS